MGILFVIKSWSDRNSLSPMVWLSQWSMLLLVVFLLSGCGTPPSAQNGAPQAAANSVDSQTPEVSPTGQPTAPVAAKPLHLIIPSIKINAPVEALGILPNGDLATPTQSPWENVGWYNAGPLPGARGSAVIDGHLDRPGGSPAVFWNLRTLHVGDKVMVSMTSGQTISFHVTRIALYAPQDAPIQEIFGDNGGSYLNLITCAGDWIPSQHQTTLRLVVYTSLG